MFRKPIFGHEKSGLRFSLIVIGFVLLIYYIVKTNAFGLLIPAFLGALAFGKYLVDVYSE